MKNKFISGDGKHLLFLAQRSNELDVGGVLFVTKDVNNTIFFKNLQCFFVFRFRESFSNTLKHLIRI